MSSEATGLSFSSLSPEFAVHKICKRIRSFGALAQAVLAIGSLSVPLLCHATTGSHSPAASVANGANPSRLLASMMVWRVDVNGFRLRIVAASALCCLLIWMLHRLHRTEKPTKVGLPVLRVHSPVPWTTRDDETRNELSRELHDSVGPLLTAMGLQLNALRSSPNISPEMGEQLGELNHLNAEALRHIRDLAMGIRPALLTDVNVVAALDYQAREFCRRTGIAASVSTDASVNQLPDEHRTCIYRCVAEALTNCAKHSRAKNIQISIGMSEGSVIVQVEDDGVGIEQNRHGMGLGLLGMRERVSQLGGRFTLASRQRSGTLITLEIPTPGGVLA
jgi:signal transduction histidine kinase